MIDALSSMDTYQALLLILILLQALSSTAKPSNQSCVPSSCGDIHNISYPFRLNNDLKGCGDSRFELICEDNHTVLYLNNSRYYVQSIDHSASRIKLVDDGIRNGDCSSLPRHSPLWSNLNNDYYRFAFDYYDPGNPKPLIVVIVNCSKPISSSFYIAFGPSCTMGSYSSNTSLSWNLYALVYPKASDFQDFCTIHSWSWMWVSYFDLYEKINSNFYNYKVIHSIMADGFFLDYGLPTELPTEVTPYQPVPFYCMLGIYSIYMGQHCGYNDTNNSSYFCVFDFHSIFRGQVCGRKYYSGGLLDDMTTWTIVDFISLLVYICAVKFVIGMPFVTIYLIYTYRRRHLAMDKNIEEFLQAHNNFLPIRYSYSNIKKITANFKYKLGEGGYGSVFKGTLRSGNEVAIKILKQSKGHGQDFINEVASIGRIHHVNVVELIGFCFEGSKQALVYDLMSNGSLDKQIFTEEGDKFLDYKKIYEIALGVARGIEYLHRGCDMQILHFDIKPHNILLDKNFIPKVSDFGLAKLYPTSHNIVSLTAARGTLGYMAPELFYRYIGGVSYKADVYSFGMLLMEMAGRRKNINANAERSSQIYFPLWVYDHFNEVKSVEMEIVAEERQVTKKMIIVALWCIQLNPDHRPTMSKVLEMLEGDIEELQMPPKPLIYAPDVPDNNDEVEMELETFSTSSSTLTNYASFPLGDTNDV